MNKGDIVKLEISSEEGKSLVTLGEIIETEQEILRVFGITGESVSVPCGNVTKMEAADLYRIIISIKRELKNLSDFPIF